jgi:hypothetical protein
MRPELVAPLIVAAIAVALSRAVRRRRTDAPTTVAGFPAQLDRADFARPDAPWLVVVFTSATCGTCSEVISKASVLESDQVAVVECEYGADRATHERYGISAVPLLVVADDSGTVTSRFVGPVKAQDLWAAVARGRGDDT